MKDRLKKTRKFLKWFFISVSGLLGLILISFIVIVSIGITLTLDRFRPSVENAVSSALNRNVEINGPVSMKVSLQPILEIQGVQVDNPDGWDDAAFASMDLARIQIGIWALLNEQIDIGEITAKKLTLNLHVDEQGMNNWQFGGPRDDATKTAEPKARSKEPANIGLQALDSLSLDQIDIRYRDDSVNKTFVFSLEELQGTAPQGQPLKLNGKGSIQDIPYSFSIDAGALDQFHLRRQLYPVSINGEIAGSPFASKGTLGTDAGQPVMDLDSTLSKVNIGAVLQWLKLAEEIDAKTDELGLKLQLKGDNLQKILTQSNVVFSLQGGHWTLYGAGMTKGLDIGIVEGSVSALTEQPLSVNLDAIIDENPVDITIQGTQLVNYFQDPEQLPVAVEVKAADTTLDFKGNLAVPVSRKDVSLAMTLQGQTLASLNELLRLDLPPIGPYMLEAQFAMNPQKYDLSNLKIKIGTSDLVGSMTLSMEGEKPNIQSKLSSSLLQINDFALGQWSPEKGIYSEETEKPVQEAKEEKSSAQREQEKQKAAALLSPEALQKADAHLSVQLNKVMSGDDTLGNGRLEVGLLDGRFSIEPLELELADGTARMDFSYYPTEQNARIELAANVTGLDVGVLVRRKRPESTMGGRLNLDLRLDSTAPELGEFMANGSGQFDLGFSPENFDAGVLDLWAVNVLSALSRKVDSEPTSTINCLVASFEMDQGLMQDRVIFIDTTRMSVEGTAVIDFKKRTIDVKAKPTAKRPEFFSIAIPIQVNGTFDDFGIGVKPGHLITTLGSFVTSPVHVPLRRVFGGKIPADRTDACRIAWERRNQPIP